ncbi:ABC transporter substrate-binding protein [Alkalihalobacillus oceani]|uniref:ABC transporter substrate-binding protein n=1 Tax=Halalkalibacter oceani TaxID=1653776 RepID=A0A9X2DRE4_9BACI|nr:ABC transporter substrate-binding protein [Halalkalibacter oceani]
MRDIVMRRLRVSLFFLLFIPLAACTTSGETATLPVTGDGGAGVTVTDFAGREVGLEQTPRRLVSLVQADAEIVQALGGEVVGRPTVQNQQVSEALQGAEEVGTAHDIDFEKVVSLQPDLVIGHAELNRKDVDMFASLGIPVVLTSGNSYDDVLQAVELYGRILGKEEQAGELLASLDVDQLELTPLAEEVKALIIFGSADTMMAALPSSLSGDLLALAGGLNIAEGLPQIEHYPQYAQLSMERVLEADPDIVYFIAHGDAEAVKEQFEAEVKSNSSWQHLQAVEQGRLVILPPELFSSNPGPRIGEALQFIHESVTAVAEKGR